MEYTDENFDIYNIDQKKNFYEISNSESAKNINNNNKKIFYHQVATSWALPVELEKFFR